MHEASLAFHLVELVQETLARHGLRRALALHVEVGALAMVDPQALALAFASAKQDTPCAQAQLQLTFCPAQTTCPHCQTLVHIQHRTEACPSCGLYDGWPCVGDSLLLKTLEAD
ncbi:MAG: hydrogenase maturation nickel metallochaperone HypA [Proteobacteria bacterium]|nr:hydrogenase maturation nickel metallochaperone HypA [Cystobacterineae bacterium]MCL2314121.1 hydrogenase maturation nickel metallochaperone HypA [Pseudomonadota bacterium]